MREIYRWANLSAAFSCLEISDLDCFLATEFLWPRVI